MAFYRYCSEKRSSREKTGPLINEEHEINDESKMVEIMNSFSLPNPVKDAVWESQETFFFFFVRDLIFSHPTMLCIKLTRII